MLLLRISLQETGWRYIKVGAFSRESMSLSHQLVGEGFLTPAGCSSLDNAPEQFENYHPIGARRLCACKFVGKNVILPELLDPTPEDS